MPENTTNPTDAPRPGPLSPEDELAQREANAEATDRLRAARAGAAAESGPQQPVSPTDRMLAHFAHTHLPPDLAAVSAPCGELARAMVRELPGSAELTVGLRKLLEAKDCFVRARLEQRRAEAGIG